MPLCTLYLLALAPNTSIADFLNILHSTSLKPLTIARVIRWIITPTTLSTPLVAQKWDILITVNSTDAIPAALNSHIVAQWSVKAGVPSRITSNFSGKNQSLLHPDPATIPPRTNDLSNPLIAPTSQNLELSPDLRTWIQSPASKSIPGPVSMLNLLAFAPGQKENYLKYGAAFASSIGSKRGGDAKIVGSVVEVKGVDGVREEGWDEVAIAHYPSIEHFGDMLASKDYQEVNAKWRVPSLRDTFILCTDEVGVWEGVGSKSKL